MSRSIVCDKVWEKEKGPWRIVAKILLKHVSKFLLALYVFI